MVNVFLLGGGTRLAAHLGALEALENHSGPITAWAGASAGSLIAAFRAVGFTRERALQLLIDTDFRQFFELRPLELFRGYGLCSGRRLEMWLDKALGGICFGDLPAPLSIVCTNVESGAPVIFSNAATPEVNVAAAVRCSVGIPGLFSVRRINGAFLVDGGLVPVDEAGLFPAARAPSLTIRLVRERLAKPMTRKLGWLAYVQRVAGLLLDAGDDPRFAAAPRDDVLTIRTDCHSSVDFDLSADDKRELYRMGREQCQTLLDSRHPHTASRTPWQVAHEPRSARPVSYAFAE